MKHRKFSWVSSREYQTVSAFLTDKTGLDIQTILHPKVVKATEIQNMVAASECIKEAVRTRKQISIVGDYDADGITSTAILVMLLCYFDVSPHVIIPKRFTDGYGISERIVDTLPKGLIITVDNGIAAVEAIALAKQDGNSVLVLDHHLTNDILPNADIIVDPHVNPEANGFCDYCGAGLALK